MRTPGPSYKIAFGKLHKKQALTVIRGAKDIVSSANILKTLMKAFFPDDCIRDQTKAQRDLVGELQQPYLEHKQHFEFQPSKVRKLVMSQSNGKSPGIDNIPAELIKHPDIIQWVVHNMTDIINSAFNLGYFPESWKVANVIAIPKPNKDSTTPKGWRPICLLPILDKVLDRLMIDYIIKHVKLDGGINPRQYGFIQGKSTIHAIEAALTCIRTHRKTAHVAVVLLNVSGAFDNCWHPALFAKLRRHKLPANVYHLMTSYLTNRKATITVNQTSHVRFPKRGCLQGSVSGPGIWNLSYDGFLSCLDGSPGVKLQAYADDALMIFWDPSIVKLKAMVTRYMKSVIKWGQTVRLEFGPEKTEIMLVKRRKYAGLSKTSHITNTRDKFEQLEDESKAT